MRGQHRRGSGVLSSVFLCLLFAISHIEVAAQEVVSSSKLAKIY